MDAGGAQAMSTVLLEQFPQGESFGVSPCVACRLPLPIVPALESAGGRYWHCVKCGARHRGRLVAEVAFEYLANIRPADFATPSKAILTADAARNSPPLGALADLRAAQGVATEALPGRGPIDFVEQTATSQALDDVVSRRTNLLAASGGSPVLGKMTRHAARPYDSLRAESFVSKYDDSIRELKSLTRALQGGQSYNLEVASDITRDALSRAAEDLDLFIRLSINPHSHGYPDRHSLDTAMLAMSMGAHMGWDEKTLVELGVGCLLHDVGMLRVPQGLYGLAGQLDDETFIEIARHPLHTFNLLDKEITCVPLNSRMVAYQIHERCNGHGYPRRRRGDQIHELAKVAAVADVYVALVSPRPHRPALMPHHALRHILYGVKGGVFDRRAVRALVKTVSLFPIGSYLQLQDGRAARVLRSNPHAPARPVIEVWAPDRWEAAPTIVDLAVTPNAMVERALPALPHQGDAALI